MKLVKVILKNFRGYNNTTIELHPDLNVLIAENDVGKSTILDALNIFFNDDAKIDTSDCNIHSEDKFIEIGACFRLEDNELVILDATNPTSLKEEHLLNREDLLEIRKVINASGKTITKSSISVYLNTFQPTLFEKPLITYKQSELKQLLNQYKLEIENFDSISKSKKADMRIALFSHLISEQTRFEEKQINIKDIQDDSLKTWDKLRDQLPYYTLFQSDRTNTDGDKEVQDPMKAITKEVLADLKDKLEEIKNEVVSKVEKIGEETIEKLKEFNEEIANQLITVPEIKSWDSLFKFNLDTDDGVPLNKRGSGVRRLILLSYFRAQAEKDAIRNNRRNIIYAIEEPETSQHPNYQRMIIDSLKTISEKEQYQVFITTHTPEIAQMVEKDSLILLQKDIEGHPQVVKNEDIKMQQITKTLGILPSIHSRVVICVEGPNDVNFIKNINKFVPEFKEIIDLENADISIYYLGGSNLKAWVNEDHFRKSNIFEFHLYDGDIPKYRDIVNTMNEKNDGRRFGVVTSLREMENYIPPRLIEEQFGVNLDEYLYMWNEFDIPEHLKKCTLPHITNMREKEKRIKQILNGCLTKKITADLLKEHGVYEEIAGWFQQIKEIYERTSGLTTTSR
ncbi:ATP-binding protein [Weizmannia coagulans]|uniref:ATP-dependent OLD family endonuclease n=3 Tax=Bacteria TaxID=2 RepID=A0AAN0T9I8_HEYCO|nr:MULTISPECIES: ATP-binding protein [Heyndrickxia]AJO24444.1 ATP-dependent OLD family endonuclease [Heyndrickxia coagulans]AKN54091.1 Putative ATP-dependent endonuclease, OLD family [Heyndrickxia coagulans]ATW84265.1 OLD family endonuclease [Heyndrickxia coagulans]KGB30359.1 ATP-dependent OLD family endonuclease [Heyndrickxia coagulans]KXT20279.1 ATP-dependent OLD family endonuclease [Heyndrickxia coagulans]